MKELIELVELRKNNVITTSRKIAEVFNKRHSDVIRALENLECSKEFNERNFASVKYTDEKGEKRKEYIITKDGFVMLVMGFTGKKATQFKEQYINAFNYMQSLLQEKNTPEYIETRHQSKLSRKSETDAIKIFIEYAKEQGSKNSDKYYITYSKLANKIAGIDNRDNATIMQLNNLSLIEQIILKEIRQGMAKGKHYKEIYQDCKKRLEDFSDIAYLQIA